MIKRLFKSIRFWLLMLLPISAALTLAAKTNQDFAEFYYEYIYKYVSLFFNNITGILPFSLGELIIFAVPLALLFYLIYVIIKTVKNKENRLKRVFKSFLNILCTLAVCLFLFTTNCGMNYYRKGFSELSGLQVQPVSSEQLYKTCVYLAQNASEVRERLNENSKGTMRLSDNSSKRAKDYVNSLSEKYDFLSDGYSSTKNVICSKGLSYLNITGVYFPFTFEANVNVDVPDFSIPSTMCHELAHVRGIMHEEDANFVSFLACINSNDDEFLYSGYTMALIYSSNSLYSADKEKYYELFSKYISDKVKNDFAEQSKYWAQFETPVAQASSNINDSYLKSNSQSQGVKSYGKMVDLVIAYLQTKI